MLHTIVASWYHNGTQDPSMFKLVVRLKYAAWFNLQPSYKSHSLQVLGAENIHFFFQKNILSNHSITSAN